LVAAAAERMLTSVKAKKKVKGKNRSELVALLVQSPSLPVKDIKALPEDWFEVRHKSCPVGYAALTMVGIGGALTFSLLDSGASVCAIPEEILILIIEHARVNNIEPDSPKYPIRSVQRYQELQSLVGIDTSKNDVKTEFGVYITIEFVPHTGSRGEGLNEVRTIYFKVLPAGCSSFKGLFFGLPVLDAVSCGLGWTITESTHHFELLGYGLPRMELARRRSREMEMESWLDAGDYTEVIGRLGETVKRLQEVPPNACFDADDVSLGPYEQAIMPVTWDRPLKDEIMYVETALRLQWKSMKASLKPVMSTFSSMC